LPRILLIAATTGYQTRAFAEAAKRMGIDLTLATDRCHVLNDPWNDQAAAVRFEEPHASAQQLAGLTPKPDGIVAVADRSTLLASLTAEQLGILWHPPQAISLCLNKSRMRAAFLAAGLKGPSHFSVSLASDPHHAAARAEYPCVLKPLGLSASRGVIRADDEAAFITAFERVRHILQLPEIRRLRHEEDLSLQIERYIPGKEFALEGIMTNGELRVLALFDKPDPLEGPFFEETIYVTPSRETQAVQKAIFQTCAQAVRALGLTHGPIHAEMRVNEKGVFMLEIAGRPIGGLCARALRFTTQSLEDLIVLHATGAMPAHLEPATPASGVMMIPTPADGVLESVAGVDEAKRTAFITGVEVTAKQGEHLIPLPEGASYPGFIFAEGPDPASVESALRRAHAKLRFTVLATLPALRSVQIPASTKSRG
jgi:biotin carboxylase